ncbi:MAG: hypothetical protein J3R72DRAFT_448102 [Linnemannia gamsii]|nr:MAG: hypothetical protein J3R72DRAFT_448102 [Linnemannia gamsii]
MKIISFALCLAAVAYVAVEAAPGSVGSHFRARMIRDKEAALLQRRDGLGSEKCTLAYGNALTSSVVLRQAIRNSNSATKDKAEKFEDAIKVAKDEKTMDALAKLREAYAVAIDAIKDDDNLINAVKNMMNKINEAVPACQ